MSQANYTVYIADCTGEWTDSEYGDNLTAALDHRDTLRARLDRRKNFVRVCDQDDPERGEFDWDFEE